MTRERDVVVVGGGVMGAAAAWRLAARGADVLLLERFGPGHTRGASHGASRIFRLTYADPVHVGLAWEALGLWRDLEAETGAALLTLTGAVQHGRHPRLAGLEAALSAAGLPPERLTAAEATERWPGFRFAGTTLHHAVAGRLDADAAVGAFAAAARARGAELRYRTRVAAIEASDHRAGVTTADGETVRARAVVVTAGAWTTGLLGPLVPLPPLRVTQEEPAYFTPAAGAPRDADWPSFTHALAPGEPGAERFHGGVYGLGTPGHGVKVGFHGVGRVVDPDHRPPAHDEAALDRLREYVRAWLPGLDPDSAEPISCTYTSTPDEVFVLDRTGPLVLGTGFSGHGFKFAPAVGRVLADLALDGARPEDRFALDRFSRPLAGASR